MQNINDLSNLNSLKNEIFEVFGLLSPKTQDALIDKMSQQRLKIYRIEEQSNSCAPQPDLNFITSTQASEVLPLVLAARDDINLRMRKLNGNLIQQLFLNHASLRQDLREISIFNKQVVHLNGKDPAPSQETLHHQLKIIHRILAILSEAAPAAESPGLLLGLIEKLQNAINRLRVHLTEIGEPQINKVLQGMRGLVKGEKKTKGTPLPEGQRKQVLAALSAKTTEKIQTEMVQSAAVFGITIGEQVCKHTGIETEALGSGGEACFADEIERRALEKMKNDPSLTETEKKKFEAYYRAAQRSREFNNALEALYSFMENNPPEKMDSQELNLLAIYTQALTDEFYSSVIDLEDGESFFMNAGHLNHAFRIVVHRKGDQFDITLCEPGSGMEATILSHSGIAPQIRAMMLKESGYPVHTGLRITVSKEHFHNVGHAYVRGLIERSAIGLEDQVLCTPIAEAISALEASLKNLSEWRLLSKLFLRILLQIQLYRELIPWKAKWTKTLKVFAAIAPDTAQLLPQMQRQQRIGVCYARRLRPNAIHEMGATLYQKLNGYVHEISKEEVLENALKRGFIDEKHAQKLKTLVPRKLAPITLKKAAEILSRCETIPPHLQHPLTPEMIEENARALKAAILMMNHAIARLAIPRAIKRPANTGLLKATLAEVLFSNPNEAAMAEATKVTRTRPTRFRTKEYVMEMEIQGQRREVSKHAYLNLVLQNTQLLFNRDISNNVLFLCKDRELTAQESQLKSKILAFQRTALPKATEKTLQDTEKKLSDLQNQLILELDFAKARPHDPHSAARSVILEIHLLQLETKLKELRTYMEYLQNPGFPETEGEALVRKNNPSFISESYFGAQGYAHECNGLIQEINGLLLKG